MALRHAAMRASGHLCGLSHPGICEAQSHNKAGLPLSNLLRHLILHLFLARLQQPNPELRAPRACGAGIWSCASAGGAASSHPALMAAWRSPALK